VNKSTTKKTVTVNQDGDFIVKKELFDELMTKIRNTDSGSHSFQTWCCTVTDRDNVRQKDLEAENRVDATQQCYDFFQEVNGPLDNEIGDGFGVGEGTCDLEE
jgi:hypothetical protein